MQIMYVCTGNQCRSVMAEYYTRAKLCLLYTSDAADD